MTQPNDYLIGGDQKLADAIEVNERLLLVIERFGISLGFGDKTILEVCRQYELDPDLVLLVLNVFVNHSCGTEGLVKAHFIPGLIDYLKSGHRYFLGEKLPYIKELIGRFIEHTDNPHTSLLQDFFTEYSNEVHEHMALEDRTVFPYMLALYAFYQNEPVEASLLQYKTDEFLDHHTDIEEKLEDLKHLLIKHFPPTEDRFFRNQILLELFNLEYDLYDHARLEDRILSPLVMEIEKKLAANGKI